MKINFSYLFILSFVILSYSCKKDLEETDQYRRPDWLAGKVYTQIQSLPELSIFAECIKLTGYDSLINITGTYTAFAPNNDAFGKYFADHPQYPSISSIPKEELLRIVKFHIIKDPWSEEQLRKLDVFGWIDTTDENNNKPKGFKRESLLRDPDKKYGVTISNKTLSIVDTTLSPWYRRQATDGNKFASLFYKEYLDVYNLTSNDYEFYFGRPFENSNDMYFMEAKLVNPNIFAENGFVHIIDRVVEPAQNAYEMLNKKGGPYSYAKFLDLINKFPNFTYNRDKTIAQPGAKEGLKVDSLFDINYSDLTFDILNEQTKAPAGSAGLPSNVTIRYQNGLVAPTDEALAQFETDYLKGPEKWGSLEGTSPFIKRIIINSWMSGSPLYPSQFSGGKGYLNGEKDNITIDPSTIVQKQFGSNCTFIGVNKAIVPKAFSSISGPVYLNRKYDITMSAIEEAKLLSVLKTEGVKYSFYVEHDDSCKADSSLTYISRTLNNQTTKEFTAWIKLGTSGWQGKLLTVNDLRTLLMNHIGVEVPKGVGRKEFIRTLGGNYLVVDNINQFVSGTAQTYRGYQGTDKYDNTPVLISNNADNGNTYRIDHWMSFSAPDIYTRISNDTELSMFQKLLEKAGLADTKLMKYNFLSDNEYYTVFAPTNQALTDYNADTISNDNKRLEKFLRMHFIQGNMIFTDGKSANAYYETTRKDEKSSSYTTYFTRLWIETGIDQITFRTKDGNVYVNIDESNKTNMITGRNLSTGTPAYNELISTAVIHHIDKVLLISTVNTD